MSSYYIIYLIYCLVTFFILSNTITTKHTHRETKNKSWDQKFVVTHTITQLTKIGDGRRKERNRKL